MPLRLMIEYPVGFQRSTDLAKCMPVMSLAETAKEGVQAARWIDSKTRWTRSNAIF